MRWMIWQTGGTVDATTNSVFAVFVDWKALLKAVTRSGKILF